MNSKVDKKVMSNHKLKYSIGLALILALLAFLLMPSLASADSWTQTTVGDFNAGVKDQVEVIDVGVGDGDVILGQIDQSQVSGNSEPYIIEETGNSQRVAQTFQCGMTGNLNKITIKARAINDAAPLIVELGNCIDGKPGNIVYASDSRDDIGEEFAEYHFDLDCSVTSGSKYTIIIKTEKNGRYKVKSQSGSDTYDNGSLYYSNDGGENWKSENFDLYFKTFVCSSSPGTIASQVYNTGQEDASWNQLSWNETLDNNTDITFEVRASDTEFTKDADTPSWTDLGTANSPISSGLPSGRYQQWRAALTTSDTSNTPTLHDVTITYTAANQPPNAPSPVSPADALSTTDTTPTLTWDVPSDADGDSLHFKVEISTTSDFSSGVATYESKENTTGFDPTPPVAQGTGTCSYTVQSALANGTWYWRVITWDGTVYGNASTARSVIIDTTGPVIDTLTSSSHPNQANWYTDDTPTFSWTTSDATSGVEATWRLLDQIATRTAAYVIANGTQDAEDGSWTETTPKANGTWYFHLAVRDNVGKTAVSHYTVNIDDSTPDIVGISCYTDNTKSTSIPEAIWQADGTVYFEWTDPASPSDDTFYYEYNANSGNTITGNESTTTNNYVNDVTLTEGTRYFHVRPKNGAGTWGTELIFTIKYDTSGGVNPLKNFLVEKSGGGVIPAQNAGTPFTIRITARDSSNNTVTTFTGTVNITSTGNLSAGGGATAAFTAGVLSSHSVTISNTGTFTITATYNSNTGTSNSFDVNPASFVVTTEHSGTEQAGTSFSVTLTAKDADGKTATGYEGSKNITWTWTASNSPNGTSPTKPANGNQTFTAGVATVSGFTLVNSGKTSTITASDGTINGTSAAITVNPAEAENISKVSGDCQSGDSGWKLDNPFVVEVTDDYDNPVSGTTVTWSITEKPSGASGQDLSAPSTSTDSNGEAQSILTLGDKAGVYKVQASCSGLSGSPVTFTATTGKSYFIKGMHYHEFSIPYQLDNGNAEVVLDELGPYDPSKWRLFRYNGDGDYNEYPNTRDFSPGLGYWLITAEDKEISIEDRPLSSDYTLTLKPGWNQIGCPFTCPVTWDSIKGKNPNLFDNNKDNGEVADVLWGYDGVEYVMSSEMDPWHGYWVYNSSESSINFIIPCPGK